MPKLKWDQPGDHLYETGVRNGVLFPMASDGTYQSGVAWNGLTSVSDNRDGGDANDQYADDQVYLSLRSTEKATGTIQAFTYPDEFAACDGSAEVVTGVTIGQQTRKGFGFCYRTGIGSDTNQDKGFKLHIVYGATVSPSEKTYETVNDSPEPIDFSWDYTTIPVEVGTVGGVTYKPTSVITIDSTKADETKLGNLMDILYGTDGEGGSTGTASRLPLPAEVFSTLG